MATGRCLSGRGATRRRLCRRLAGAARADAAAAAGEATVVAVCTSKDCRRRGAAKAAEQLASLCAAGCVSSKVAVEERECLGECGMGPNVVCVPKGSLAPDDEPPPGVRVHNGVTAAAAPGWLAGLYPADAEAIMAAAEQPDE